MKKIKDLSSALDVFVNAASKQGDATETGDYKIANLCYRDIEKAASYLKENNQLQSLHIFLKHSSVGVRIWAAGYLLHVDEAEADAVKTLKEIGDTFGIHSLTAKTTLSEWLNGNLKP